MSYLKKSQSAVISAWKWIFRPNRF